MTHNSPHNVCSHATPHHTTPHHRFRYTVSAHFPNAESNAGMMLCLQDPMNVKLCFMSEQLVLSCLKAKEVANKRQCTCRPRRPWYMYMLTKAQVMEQARVIR